MMPMMKKISKRVGFTLIESIVSLAILSIIGVMVIASVTAFGNMWSRDTDSRNDSAKTETAIATGQTPTSTEYTEIHIGGYVLPTDISTYTEGRESHRVLGAGFFVPEGMELDGTPEVGNVGGTTGEYIVQQTGRYKIEVWGAAGGQVRDIPGYQGAYATSTVKLTKGEKLNLLAGGMGGNGAGGGGSFVVIAGENTPVAIAGGGGGRGGLTNAADATNNQSGVLNNYGQSGTSGGSVSNNGGGVGGAGGNSGITNGPASGGGGLIGNGSSSGSSSGFGRSYITGGAGGAGNGTTLSANGFSQAPGNGGLGGGGGAYNNNTNGYYRGGGGGGYSGGQGGSYTTSGGVTNAGGGGGGSYFVISGNPLYVDIAGSAIAGNATMPEPHSYNETSKTYSSVMTGNAGNGFVRITWVGL
jgi:prepilin-type N-terminal cleavage/methylation domain-containing protein